MRGKAVGGAGEGRGHPCEHTATTLHLQGNGPHPPGVTRGPVGGAVTLASMRPRRFTCGATAPTAPGITPGRWRRGQPCGHTAWRFACGATPRPPGHRAGPVGGAVSLAGIRPRRFACGATPRNPRRDAGRVRGAVALASNGHGASLAGQRLLPPASCGAGVEVATRLGDLLAGVVLPPMTRSGSMRVLGGGEQLDASPVIGAFLSQGVPVSLVRV